MRSAGRLGRERRRQEQLEHPAVAGHVLGALQVERVGGAVEGDHVALGRAGKPKIVNGPSIPAWAPASVDSTWRVTAGRAASSAAAAAGRP